MDQLWNQILALLFNIISWAKSFVLDIAPIKATSQSCIVITGPGGMETFVSKKLETKGKQRKLATCGYNLHSKFGIKPPFVDVEDTESLPPTLALVRVKNFSVNYADVCIRWGKLHLNFICTKS